MRIIASSLVLGSVFLGSCQRSNVASDLAEDTSRMRGFSLPGKGYNVTDNTVGADICVNGDKMEDEKSSFDDPFGPSNPWDPFNPDNRDRTNPRNPRTNPRDPRSNPQDPSKPGEELFPGGDPFKPESSKQSLNGIKVSFDDADDIAPFSLDQAGQSNVQFMIVEKMSELKVALDTTFELSGGASRGASNSAPTAEGAPAAEPQNTGTGAGLKATLEAKYKNSSQHVFVVMHGRKEFPWRKTDQIVNPRFNSALRSLVFGSNARPANEEATADSWRRFVQLCGDHYVQSLVRGREVWMVGVLDKADWDAQIKGSLGYGSKAGVSGGSVAEVKGKIDAQVKSDVSYILKKLRADIYTVTRGKNQIDSGKFDLDGAIGEVNKFMTATETPNEAVIAAETASYDKVKFEFEQDQLTLGGDLFTRKVRDYAAQNSDVFVKLRNNEVWANKELDNMWKSYGWEQWSFDRNSHNGVALQFLAVEEFKSKIASVFQYCESRSPNINAVSQDCLDRAQAAAKLARPELNLPQPLTTRLEVWINPALLDTIGKKDFNRKKVEHTFETESKTCSAEGWTVPSLDHWRRIVDASNNYNRWRSQQNPGYKAVDQKDPLAAVCGKVVGSYFWTDQDETVVRLPHQCSGSAVNSEALPESQRYSMGVLYKTRSYANVACVRFK